MLLAFHNACSAFADGRHGCQCLHCWICGMRCCPLSSRTPMMIGLPLHVINTFSSLCTVMPSLLKMEIIPSSDVFRTFISDDGKCLNASAFVACLDSCGNGRLVDVCCFADVPIGNLDPFC